MHPLLLVANEGYATPRYQPKQWMNSKEPVPLKPSVVDPFQSGNGVGRYEHLLGKCTYRLQAGIIPQNLHRA